MRTTIRIDDDLLKKAKRFSIETGITLTALIEDSLRERLNRSEGKSTKRNKVRLKTVGVGGLQPGIDLDDAASMLDSMEDLR